MKICVVAGNNPDYVFSFVQALARFDVGVELIGAETYESFVYPRSVTFLNLRGSQDWRAPVVAKVARTGRFYLACLFHLWQSDARLVHIQSFRFKFIEGVMLVFLYRLLGKKVVYTAHNVQEKSQGSPFDHLLFKLIYRNVDHIICHTERIKEGIISRFAIRHSKVSVIQRGLNDSVTVSSLSGPEARKKIGLTPSDRVLLMFGRIRPDKGYDIALQALQYLPASAQPVTLLIAGGVASADKLHYLKQLKEYVAQAGLAQAVQFYDHHIPDREVEIFFKAADVLLLPYKEADFQSGVLFLAYRFGLPIIASDVGSVAPDPEPGRRQYIFASQNPQALAAQIVQFYQDLQPRCDARQPMLQYGERYSWDNTVRATITVYRRLLQGCG